MRIRLRVSQQAPGRRCHSCGSAPHNAGNQSDARRSTTSSCASPSLPRHLSVEQYFRSLARRGTRSRSPCVETESLFTRNNHSIERHRAGGVDWFGPGMRKAPVCRPFRRCLRKLLSVPSPEVRGRRLALDPAVLGNFRELRCRVGRRRLRFVLLAHVLPPRRDVALADLAIWRHCRKLRRLVRRGRLGCRSCVGWSGHMQPYLIDDVRKSGNARKQKHREEREPGPIQERAPFVVRLGAPPDARWLSTGGCVCRR